MTSPQWAIIHPVVCQKSADPKRQQFPNTGGWHDRRSRPACDALTDVVCYQNPSGPLSGVSGSWSPVATPPSARRNGGEDHPIWQVGDLSVRRRPILRQPTRRGIPQLACRRAGARRRKAQQFRTGPKLRTDRDWPVDGRTSSDLVLTIWLIEVSHRSASSFQPSPTLSGETC